MKNSLRNFLHNARAVWILLALEIIAVAIIYATARVGGLSDSVSVIISCGIGTLLVTLDIVSTRKFNIQLPPILSSFAHGKNNTPSNVSLSITKEANSRIRKLIDGDEKLEIARPSNGNLVTSKLLLFGLTIGLILDIIIPALFVSPWLTWTDINHLWISIFSITLVIIICSFMTVIVFLTVRYLLTYSMGFHGRKSQRTSDVKSASDVERTHNAQKL